MSRLTGVLPKLAFVLSLLFAAAGSVQARGFLPPVKYPVGMHPVDAAVADFNGDGKPDVAVANNTGNSISILFGNGDGTFVTGRTYPCRDPQALVAADLNRDGKVDLVAACQVRPGVGLLVFLNSSSGFLSPQGYGAYGLPSCLAVGDFDGDAIPDIVAAVGDAVSFVKGNGDGSFQPPQSFMAGVSIDGLAAADLNKDGKLDLVAADQLEGADVLLGNGDGTFAAPAYIFDGSQPLSVALGDLNRDGNLDLVLADLKDTVTLCLGNGDGTFQAPVTYTVGKEPRSVSLGDFNGDGVLDVAVVLARAGSITVMFGRGDGTFPLLTQFPAGGPDAICWRGVAADLNHDRVLDLVVVDENTASISILMNSGSTDGWPSLSRSVRRLGMLSRHISSRQSPGFAAFSVL